MSPLLGGHLHLARDSLIGEDEEVTPLLQLSRGLDLGDFVSTAPLPPQCLRRSVGMTSFIFAPGTKSRSPSPGLRACSSRAAVSPSSPLLSSRIRRSGTIATNGPNRPNQSPHFWQPWSAREVKSPHPIVALPNQSPREAKHSGRSAIRGRSPRSPTAGHSPKSSPSPETSRSPSLGAAAAGARNAPPGARMALPQRRSRGGVGSPRAASPFNPHTDYDIHLDLPVGKWHRFETRVGIADESKWPSATRAKFQVIEDDKTLLWESTESLELWAPMELCSVLMAEKSCEKGPGGLKHLCLRVRCSAPPEGAVWIDPVLTMRPEKREKRSSRSSQVVNSVDRSDRSNRLVDRSFQEMFASELLMELVCRLSCCDVARLLTACRHGLQSQQAAWHCAFAHSFKQAYLRYFLGPLRKPTGPNGTAIQWLGGSQNGSFTFVPYGRNDGGHTHRPSGPLGRTPPVAGPAAIPPTWRQNKGSAQMAVCCQSCRMAPETSQLPPWATELFDWRQICRRFYLSQLPYANVNFQLFNCSTPNGFVKDSGETLHVPRAFHGQSPNFRCGWNIPLGAVHFQSQPSAVVAHRSPLGVAGVPPSVATVRGTAGPEPMAMTPVISEKDSAVILPAWPQQPRLQWTLEVDPGRYLVVVTVGDRHVGFAAHLEVNGWPVFSGEWVESGSFKSRCLICETRHGAITLGQLARSGLHKDELCHQSRLAASDGLLETLAPPGSSAASDPPDPPRSPRPRGTGVLTDALAKGTRLVSIRTAAVALAREVEKERKASFGDLTAKISDARLRFDSLRQALETSPNTQLEREVHRVFAKLSELQAQKALKLFSFLASARRVTHPYIYLSGEATANP